MKKIVLILSLITSVAFGQNCNVTDASGCSCQDNSQIDCDLLPDITVSGFGIIDHMSGPSEYSQTGNGVENGRLRISGSTPNIGHGPLTVGTMDLWICGADTFSVFPGQCSDGSEPTQIIYQKIYHKNGISMSNHSRMAGGMTYHETHGHMHVDDWAVFTLRVEDPNEPDPRNWDIVGEGAKIGFCLMDFGTCSGYYGHCRDSLDNILENTDFPNYGLGGGDYDCSPVEQGISSGYTDIYGEHLDGMWINIPPGTCNGDYWIVMEVDPMNVFLEENENNNWTAVPFTLTEQESANSGPIPLEYDGLSSICIGDTLELSTAAGSNYLWSTGETTQSIKVTQDGDYFVTLSTSCGLVASETLSVTINSLPTQPVINNDSVCEGHSGHLVSSQQNTLWSSDVMGSNILNSGQDFYSSFLNQTTDFWGFGVDTLFGSPQFAPPHDPNGFGGGGFLSNSDLYLVFHAHRSLIIRSVLVNSEYLGDRTIELRDDNGVVLISKTATIPQGLNRVELNFEVPQGLSYRLGVANGPALFRHNSGVNYPYDLGNLLTIATSSVGLDYYYYMYDWEIEELPRFCLSEPTPTNIYVNSSESIEFLNLPDTVYSMLGSIVLEANPIGGSFSGDGVSQGVFDPLSNGGDTTYVIYYSATDSSGCELIKTKEVFVSTAVGNDEDNLSFYIDVFPNPSVGKFSITSAMPISAYSIYSLSGKEILSAEGRMSNSEEIDIPGLSNGIYFIQVRVKNGELITRKLIIKID